MKVFLRFLLTIILLSTLTLVPLLIKSPASAVSGSDWDAGMIIDDSIFYDNNSMSVNDIQTFLNKRVQTCDTYGTQKNETNPTMTNAQYAANQGFAGPPYICLKDYMQVPRSDTIISNFQGSTPAGSISAAQIIKNAANLYNISPKAILVIIQKESLNLINDSWPILKQYRSTMGYDCKDGVPCNPQYEGFYNQIMNAARQFNLYKNNSSSYRYKPFQSNIINYQALSTTCGTSNVYIKNYATAGLYNYTPYQPNQAALNNLYGEGNNCSAYGNRNFWRTFNDWFGSTKLIYLPGCEEATNTSLVCVWEISTSNGLQYLSSSNQEREDLVKGPSGYQYQGKAFFGNTHSLSGNIPIYRLIESNGSTFLTADKNEYNVLSGIMSPKGIAFYADPSGSNSGYPTYRLYSSQNNQHRWTIKENEKNTLISNGYKLEGIAFSSISPVKQEVAPAKDQSLIYRFSSMPGNSHFWTNNIAERDLMIKAGYRYEGVAWKASSVMYRMPKFRIYRRASINLKA